MVAIPDPSLSQAHVLAWPRKIGHVHQGTRDSRQPRPVILSGVTPLTVLDNWGVYGGSYFSFFWGCFPGKHPAPQPSPSATMVDMS